MSIFSNPISEWNHATLDQLVTDGVEESLTVEFKRELAAATRGEKREVAKDISAFANTAGGWLIYGVDENRASSIHSNTEDAMARDLPRIRLDEIPERLEIEYPDRRPAGGPLWLLRPSDELRNQEGPPGGGGREEQERGDLHPQEEPPGVERGGPRPLDRFSSQLRWNPGS